MENESLIIYLDENNNKTDCYAIIISQENGLIKFRPTGSSNEISIPNNRLIKIKNKVRE